MSVSEPLTLVSGFMVYTQNIIFNYDILALLT
jgi:hypothetical protein